MQLTKEQTIQEHRKMWNWIADQYKKRSKVNVGNLKDMYLHEKNMGGIYGHCFLCNYAGNNESSYGNYAFNCDQCLLQWPVPEDSNIEDGYCVDKYNLNDNYGLYGMLEEGYNESGNRLVFKEKENIARQIANLPERK